MPNIIIELHIGFKDSEISYSCFGTILLDLIAEVCWTPVPEVSAHIRQDWFIGTVSCPNNTHVQIVCMINGLYKHLCSMDALGKVGVATICSYETYICCILPIVIFMFININTYAEVIFRLLLNMGHGLTVVLSISVAGCVHRHVQRSAIFFPQMS